MTILTEGNYNQILSTGQDLLIALLDPASPKSVIAMEKLATIDQMIAKSFSVCTVDITSEKAIRSVLSPEELPSYVFIRQKKIQGVLTGLPTENELLALTAQRN